MESNAREPAINEHTSYRRVWQDAQDALRQLDAAIRDLHRVRESELSVRRAANRTYLKRNPLAELAEPVGSGEASER